MESIVVVSVAVGIIAFFMATLWAALRLDKSATPPGEFTISRPKKVGAEKTEKGRRRGGERSKTPEW